MFTFWTWACGHCDAPKPVKDSLCSRCGKFPTDFNPDYEIENHHWEEWRKAVAVTGPTPELMRASRMLQILDRYAHDPKKIEDFFFSVENATFSISK